MIMKYNSELPPNDKNAFVYKGGVTGTEYILPSEVGRHMPYDPMKLPVRMVDTPNTARCIALISAFIRID